MTVVFRTLMPKVDNSLWDLLLISVSSFYYIAGSEILRWLDIGSDIADWREEANG